MRGQLAQVLLLGVVLQRLSSGWGSPKGSLACPRAQALVVCQCVSVSWELRMSNQSKPVITLGTGKGKKGWQEPQVCAFLVNWSCSGGVDTSYHPSLRTFALSQLCTKCARCQVAARHTRVLIRCCCFVFLAVGFLHSSSQSDFFSFQEVVSFNFSVDRHVDSSLHKDDIGIAAFSATFMKSFNLMCILSSLCSSATLCLWLPK